MPEIVATDDLACRLSELSPTHVAVAFIGRDWRHYLDSGRLEQVVVSPGLGTNPAAVVDLAEKIGWDRVLLLDELHSKLYWSADSVLIGSANLSRAALEPGGQQEVCVLLADKDSVDRAHEIFHGYAHQAEAAFPTKTDKLARLDKLRRQRRRAWVADIPIPNPPAITSVPPTFGDYQVDRDGEVFCGWITNGDFEYTDNVPQELRTLIEDEVHVAPDDLDPGDQWFLHYYIHANDPGLHRTFKPWLMYVHEVFEDGCTDEGYERLGVQWRDKYKRTPTKPFNETEPYFIEAFRQVIGQERFSSLRGAAAGSPRQITEEIWRYQEHRRQNREFLDELKHVYKSRC